MFNLIRMTQTPAMIAQPPVARNYFPDFAVELPDLLWPLLRRRLTVCQFRKLWGEKVMHDLTLDEMAELEYLLLLDSADDARNLILDGRQLSLLNRFLGAERMIAGRTREPLLRDASNADYWIWLGDFQASTTRPTRLVPLSFFGRL